MRGLASLLAYLVGASAIIGIGIVGLMALQSPIERTSSASTLRSNCIQSISLSQSSKQ